MTQLFSKKLYTFQNFKTPIKIEIVTPKIVWWDSGLTPPFPLPSSPHISNCPCATIVSTDDQFLLS